MEGKFDLWTSKWNVYPEGYVPYEINEQQRKNHMHLEYKDNNRGMF